MVSEEAIPCPGCAEGWAPISMKYCGACYAGQVERLTKALEEITKDGPIWRAQRIAREALAAVVGNAGSGS
jgi:hypothetical protein